MKHDHKVYWTRGTNLLENEINCPSWFTNFQGVCNDTEGKKNKELLTGTNRPDNVLSKLKQSSASCLKWL